MLKGVANSLRHKPRPIWVEISSTIHQPSGITVNPYFVATFEQFLGQGYTVVMADAVKNIIELKAVQAVSEGNALFETHNFCSSSDD